jgi:hypothetical protein
MTRRMSSNTALLLALVVVSLADGAVAQYFYPRAERAPTELWFLLGYTTVLFAWYAIDSDHRGYKRSRSLNLAFVALGILALPYYLFRTRGAKAGFIALGWFLLIGIFIGPLNYVGKYATYYVLQRTITPAMAVPQQSIRYPDLTDEKLAEFEQFYSPIAATLTAFAERHNLRIEKYRYAQANWSFEFRLTEYGSRGHLQVLRVRDEQVMVVGSADHLDLWACRRLVTNGGVGEVTLPRDAAQVADALEEVLIRIVTLPISEMRPDGGDHPSWCVDRDQVRAGLAAMPLVKMDKLKGL